jgi:hypothetical protein
LKQPLRELMRARRFAPLFWTQALGAVNDNMFKNALVVLALFRLAHLGPVVVALSGGVFLLPYAVFSATAGQIADAGEKCWRVRGLFRGVLPCCWRCCSGWGCRRRFSRR